ncbi:hypothetical protein FAGKG844_220002 [Frankia sp. AgKG'84/4]
MEEWEQVGIAVNPALLTAMPSGYSILLVRIPVGSDGGPCRGLQKATFSAVPADASTVIRAALGLRRPDLAGMAIHHNTIPIVRSLRALRLSCQIAYTSHRSSTLISDIELIPDDQVSLDLTVAHVDEHEDQPMWEVHDGESFDHWRRSQTRWCLLRRADVQSFRCQTEKCPIDPRASRIKYWREALTWNAPKSKIGTGSTFDRWIRSCTGKIRWLSPQCLVKGTVSKFLRRRWRS